jgi:hypothetical protein
VAFLFGIEIGYFYIGKVVCNEKCKHDLGRGFFFIVTRKNYLLHPTSSGFESRATQPIYKIEKNNLSFEFLLTSFPKFLDLVNEVIWKSNRWGWLG